MQTVDQFKKEHGTAHAEALQMRDSLKGFEIQNDGDAITVGEIRKDVAAQLKAVEAERKKIADPQHKAWKATNVFFKKFSAPLDEAKRLTDGILRQWEHAQAAEREAEAAAAQAAARAALEAKAAAAALEAKAAAAGNAEAQAAAEVQAEVERKAAAEAFAVAQQAIAKSVAPAARAEGLQKRTVWRARIDDPTALIKAAADAKAMAAEYVAIDEAKLDRLARSIKVEGPAPGLPGVSFYKDFTFAS